MKKILLLFTFFLLNYINSYSQGNACTGATPMTVGNCMSAVTIGNNADDGLGNCNGTGFVRDGWFSFVGDGFSTIVTFAATTNNDDPSIVVYTGTCAGLVLQSCDNTTVAIGVDTETISFTTTLGTTYYVQVKNTGAGDKSMKGDICISSAAPPPPPANDNCGAAVTLTPGATCTPTSGTVAGGTASGTASGSCSGSPDDDVWYRFQATQTTHTISITPNANLNSYMQLYSGTCAALTSMSCSDPNTLVAGGLTIGNWYYIRVYSFGSSPLTAIDGTFTICVTTSTITCSGLGTIINGGTLASNYTHNSQTTCGAGDDVVSSEITSCGTSYYYDGEETVYNFIPSTSGSININVTSAGSYVGLSVFSGCPTSGGACLGYAQSFAGNQSLTCIGVIAGQNYYVIIDSWPAPDCNPYSLSVSAPVAQTAPSCATGLSPANGATGLCNTSTSLSWTAPSGTCATSASAYDVYFGTSSTPPLVTTTSATSYDPGGLATGTTYYYRIVPKNGGGTAASCPTYSFTTLAGASTCNLGYTLSTPAFGPLVGGGSWTNLSFSDDRFADANTSLPFSFCFDGIKYSNMLVSSNGFIIFPAVGCSNNMPGGVNAAPSGYSSWSFSTDIPNTTAAPRNAIMLWQDIDPSITGSSIRYKTIGTAPNRIFVLDFATVGMFSCTTDDFIGQFWLYETTNVIEIHVQQKTVCSTWNDGNAILGLHNFDGTRAVVPSGHNATSTNWTASNEAWRFTPNTTCSTMCAPLYASMLSFKGFNESNYNFITWETQFEVDNKEYVLYRGTTEKNLAPIAVIKGKGTTNALSYYKYIDYEIEFNKNYLYRLQQVDSKGAVTGEEQITVKTSKAKEFSSNVYPNPLKSDAFKLETFTPAESDNIKISIKNSFGQEVYRQDKHISYYDNTEINIVGWANGIYMVEVVSDNESKTIKLVIDK